MNRIEKSLHGDSRSIRSRPRLTTIASSLRRRGPSRYFAPSGLIPNNGQSLSAAPSPIARIMPGENYCTGIDRGVVPSVVVDSHIKHINSLFSLVVRSLDESGDYLSLCARGGRSGRSWQQLLSPLRSDAPTCAYSQTTPFSSSPLSP